MLTFFFNPNQRKVEKETAHGFFPTIKRKNGLANKEGVIETARKLLPGKISLTRDHI